MNLFPVGDKPLMLMPYGQKEGERYNSIDMYALRAKENSIFKQILKLKLKTPYTDYKLNPTHNEKTSTADFYGNTVNEHSYVSGKNNY